VSRRGLLIESGPSDDGMIWRDGPGAMYIASCLGEGRVERVRGRICFCCLFDFFVCLVDSLASSVVVHLAA
jgi:hypothetical protein